MRILLDSDPIVYQVGFASEERWYELTWWPNGHEQTAWFYNKDRLDRFMTAMNIVPEEVEFHIERESEPLPYVLATVKRKLNVIFSAIDGFLAETDIQANEYQLYLTDGAANFRNKIATIVPYKGNRDPSHKPVFYHEIREYMMKHWDARMIRGAEADDAVSIAQHAQHNLYDTCICTIDKDLRMVPGLHYNYLSKQEFYISPREGIKHFYWQLLAGDATDNIKGCYRIGKTRAMKLIDTVDTLRYDAYEQDLYDLCLEQYQESIRRYGAETKYHELGAEAALLENARLLWMQTVPGELWTPPGEPMGSIDLYEDD